MTSIIKELAKSSGVSMYYVRKLMKAGSFCLVNKSGHHSYPVNIGELKKLVGNNKVKSMEFHYSGALSAPLGGEYVRDKFPCEANVFIEEVK